MLSPQTKPWREQIIVATISAISLALLSFGIGVANADTDVVKRDPVLDKKVMATLEQCHQISASCSAMTESAVGILVFPNVVKADLIIGGSGGKGALIENGQITGYYNIGSGSAGLQAGIENSSQVYIFRTPEALAKLKQGPDWKAGATAGVTLVAADANAKGITGNVLAYVFDAKGLNAGIALDVFDVWKTGKVRPS